MRTLSDGCSRVERGPVSPAVWALGGTVLIWGCSYPATRLLVSEVPPLTAAVVRFALAAAVLLAVQALRQRRWPRVPRPAWPGLAITGFLLVPLGYGLENTGLRFTSAGNASVLTGLQPIFTLLLGRVGGWEPPLRVRQWGGVLAAAGACGAFVAQGEGVRLSDPRGDGRIVLAVLAHAVATIAAKPHAESLGPLTSLGYSAAAGALWLGPAAIWEGWQGPPPPRPWAADGMAALLFLAIPSTALAYTGFFYALSRLPAGRVSLCIYLLPLVTLGAAVGLAGEPLTAPRVGWAALAVAGVVAAGSGRPLPPTSRGVGRPAPLP